MPQSREKAVEYKLRAIHPDLVGVGSMKRTHPGVVVVADRFGKQTRLETPMKHGELLPDEMDLDSAP